jgi:transcriptional regulator with XRE-family HTH domain
MAAEVSPTIARRRVRLALREAREAARLTQQHVADEMEWSLSKVIRIENGDVSIAPNDLRPLLSLVGIRDRARIAELIADAKIARTRQRRAWYQEPKYREALTEAMRRLIEFEAEAVAVYSYSVFHFPGLLQIPEFAEALIHTWSEELDPDRIERRLDARMRRREALLARLGSVRVTALLDESVFRRPIGGDAVLAAQLRDVLSLNERGLTQVRMVPFDTATALSYNAIFDLLFLAEDGDLTSAVLYREAGLTDEIVEDIPTNSRYHARYQKLWEAALTEAETNDFIRDRLKALERSQADQNVRTRDK